MLALAHGVYVLDDGRDGDIAYICDQCEISIEKLGKIQVIAYKRPQYTIITSRRMNYRCFRGCMIVAL